MAIISPLVLLLQLANHGRCMKLSNIHSLGVPIVNYCDAKLSRPATPEEWYHLYMRSLHPTS